MSVIVPVRNSVGYIATQLDALRPQVEEAQGELIVVDDCSSDATPDEVDRWLVRAQPFPLRLIRRNRRGGANASRNDGLAIATSDVLAFCDGDDVVAAHWLGALLAEASTSRLVGGQCIEWDASGQRVVRPADPVAHGWRYSYGGNMAASRADLMLIDGFDESIRAGGSEVEMAIRGQTRGVFEVVAVPAAVIAYRRPQTPQRILRTEIRKERGRSYIATVHRSLSIEGRGPRHYFALGAVVWRSAFGSAPRSLRAAHASRALGRLVGWAFWAPVNKVGYALHLRRFRPRLLSTRYPACHSGEARYGGDRGA